MDPLKIAGLKDRLNRVEESPYNVPGLRPSARARITKAADFLFPKYGIRGVALREVAARADTSTSHVLECFGSLEGLAVDYLQAYAQLDDDYWRGLEQLYPNDAAKQLRAWVRKVAPEPIDPFTPMSFSMEAIDLLYNIDHPGRDVIRKYKTVLRNKLAELCCNAFYRDPEALADKLLMLAEGAFVQRSVFSGEVPAQRLIEATEDLFKRHWQSQ